MIRKRLQDLVQSMEKTGVAPETFVLPEKKEDGGAPSRRQQVLDAVRKRGRAACMEDLPDIERDMSAFFAEYRNNDYFHDFSSDDYFRFLDLRDRKDTRVVVVGDIHCDFYSLAALLVKLSVSDYDYFEDAFFVFMGDYLDRGTRMFETLLLLMDLKQILGEHMIMLRGNHELIGFDEDRGELDSLVIPQDSCPLMNEIFGENKAFLKAFGDFFSTLPTYVYLKVADRNVLLTHASIPRHLFLDLFHYSDADGSIVFESAWYNEQVRVAQEKTEDDSLRTMTTILHTDLLKTRNRILYDMIWGDPSHDEQKYQVSGRFQFGSRQFEDYARKNRISRVFRSHEPVRYGFESFYDDRLFTIFSTGGDGNDQAGYGNINPAFAVILGDGSYFVENSFCYRMSLLEALGGIVNPFTGAILGGKAAARASLSDEFTCTLDRIEEIESLFAALKDGFADPEESEEPAEPEAPVEPVEPEKPEEPVAPEKPEEPETPVDGEKDEKTE